MKDLYIQTFAKQTQDLIERLEKATGPDYGLSQDIGKAVDARQRYEHPGSENPSWPHYTASLDAALTLVPEGWCWRYDSSTFDAEVSDFSGRFLIDADEEWHGANKNPAIAICIASLRARVSIAAKRDLTKIEAGK